MEQAKDLTKLISDTPGPGDKNNAETRKKYLRRFDYVKKAKDAYCRQKWDVAINNYREYLLVMIEMKGVKIRQLSPKNFDHDKELAEMLVISHIFWDLAILYDRSPHLHNEFRLCLMMYLRFTDGFKYHNANMASLKRYMSVKDVHHKDDFNKALNTLLIGSKKCFVATMCFGNESSVTNSYRAIKPHLMKYHLGIKFVDFYYHYSPIFIHHIEDKKLARFIFVSLLAKPALLAGYFFGGTVKRLHALCTKK